MTIGPIKEGHAPRAGVATVHGAGARGADDRMLFRISEVAAALNISRSKVYELLQSGGLPSVHIDRTRLVRRDDLVAFVDSLTTSS